MMAIPVMDIPTPQMTAIIIMIAAVKKIIVALTPIRHVKTAANLVKISVVDVMIFGLILAGTPKVDIQ